MQEQKTHYKFKIECLLQQAFYLNIFFLPKRMEM